MVPLRQKSGPLDVRKSQPHVGDSSAISAESPITASLRASLLYERCLRTGYRIAMLRMRQTLRNMESRPGTALPEGLQAPAPPKVRSGPRRQEVVKAFLSAPTSHRRCPGAQTPTEQQQWMNDRTKVLESLDQQAKEIQALRARLKEREDEERLAEEVETLKRNVRRCIK